MGGNECDNAIPPPPFFLFSPSPLKENEIFFETRREKKTHASNNPHADQHIHIRRKQTSKEKWDGNREKLIFGKVSFETACLSRSISGTLLES